MKNETLKEYSVFIARGGSALIFFLLLYYILAYPLGLLSTMCDSTATMSGAALKILGMDYAVSGSYISIFTEQNGVMEYVVASVCLGDPFILTYCALLFAIPNVEMRMRLSGLLPGVGLIFVLNSFRVASSIYFDLQGISAFHDFFYIVSPFMVLIPWIIWLLVVKRRS